MRCPRCGKQSVISHVTIRWSQVKGSFLPSRGHYCTACKTAFEDERPSAREFAFQSIRIGTMTDALRRLQESADVIVVRHRSGAQEVLF